MTWVVAGRGLFCATAMSDVEVTLTYQDGRTVYFHALRKVQLLSPRVAILFSGSVALALQVIESLKGRFIRRIDERLFEHPHLVADKVRKGIRHFYGKLRQEGARADFIILITPTSTLTSFGVYKLSPPSFNPTINEAPFGMVEIGTGSNAEAYRAMVQRSATGLLPVDTGDRSAAVMRLGRVSMHQLATQALGIRTPGVSHSVHLTMMSHEGATYDFVPAREEDPLPQLASTWAGFVELMAKRGISMADAVSATA